LSAPGGNMSCADALFVRVLAERGGKGSAGAVTAEWGEGAEAAAPVAFESGFATVDDSPTVGRAGGSDFGRIAVLRRRNGRIGKLPRCWRTGPGLGSLV
jgi:hypothetical protein